jgi:putative transposase
VINNIPQSVQCYHRNRKEFRNKYQVIGELFQANYPGELYLIDHRKMDLLIFLDGGGSKVGRPWITGVFDQYSRSLPGYYLDFEAPSSRRVALALRHAILPKNDVNWPMCGIPTMLRHDLGKDLVSKHIQQVKIDLKIQDFPKEAANPKANAELERFFGTMADWEKKLPGWTGASVKERPEYIQPKLTLPELDRHFRSFLSEYHDRKHSTTKMAPIARWSTGLIPRLPESEDALDLLLMPLARSRKIRRNGIHFQTNRYWCDELLLYIGDIAALRYDPTRLNEIVVYVGNKRITTAVRVAGSRLTYGAYRNRRNKQIRMIRNYKEGVPQKKEADTLKTVSQDLAAFQNKGKKEILDMINHYQKQLEREPEPDKERLKLFPEPDKGDDWC